MARPPVGSAVAVLLTLALLGVLAPHFYSTSSPKEGNDGATDMSNNQRRNSASRRRRAAESDPEARRKKTDRISEGIDGGEGDGDGSAFREAASSLEPIETDEIVAYCNKLEGRYQPLKWETGHVPPALAVLVSKIERINGSTSSSSSIERSRDAMTDDVPQLDVKKSTKDLHVLGSAWLLAGLAPFSDGLLAQNRLRSRGVLAVPDGPGTSSQRSGTAPLPLNAPELADLSIVGGSSQTVAGDAIRSFPSPICDAHRSLWCHVITQRARATSGSVALRSIVPSIAASHGTNFSQVVVTARLADLVDAKPHDAYLQTGPSSLLSMSLSSSNIWPQNFMRGALNDDLCVKRGHPIHRPRNRRPGRRGYWIPHRNRETHAFVLRDVLLYRGRFFRSSDEPELMGTKRRSSGGVGRDAGKGGVRKSHVDLQPTILHHTPQFNKIEDQWPPNVHSITELMPHAFLRRMVEAFKSQSPGSNNNASLLSEEMVVNVPIALDIPPIDLEMGYHTLSDGLVNHFHAIRHLVDTETPVTLLLRRRVNGDTLPIRRGSNKFNVSCSVIGWKRCLSRDSPGEFRHLMREMAGMPIVDPKNGAEDGTEDLRGNRQVHHLFMSTRQSQLFFSTTGDPANNVGEPDMQRIVEHMVNHTMSMPLSALIKQEEDSEETLSLSPSQRLFDHDRVYRIGELYISHPSNCEPRTATEANYLENFELMRYSVGYLDCDVTWWVYRKLLRRASVRRILPQLEWKPTLTFEERELQTRRRSSDVKGDDDGAGLLTFTAISEEDFRTKLTALPKDELLSAEARFHDGPVRVERDGVRIVLLLRKTSKSRSFTHEHQEQLVSMLQRLIRSHPHCRESEDVGGGNGWSNKRCSICIGRFNGIHDAAIMLSRATIVIMPHGFETMNIMLLRPNAVLVTYDSIAPLVVPIVPNWIHWGAVVVGCRGPTCSKPHHHLYVENKYTLQKRHELEFEKAVGDLMLMQLNSTWLIHY